MYRYRRRRKRKPPGHSRGRRILLSVLIVVLILFIGIDMRIRPIIKEVAQSYAINRSVQLIDESVGYMLSTGSYEYDDLVTLVTDDEGRIAGLQTNSANINSLKAVISDQISEQISTIEREQVGIPLGTLLGGDLLAGRGPNIYVYITLTGNVNTQIVSGIEGTGINQTLHKLYLEVTTEVYIICTWYDTSTTFTTNIAIAESIIVGEVPDTFNQINTTLDDYIDNFAQPENE